MLNENDKIKIRQLKALDGTISVILCIKDVENEFDEIIGYEMKDSTGKSKSYSAKLVELAQHLVAK